MARKSFLSWLELALFGRRRRRPAEIQLPAPVLSPLGHPLRHPLGHPTPHRGLFGVGLGALALTGALGACTVVEPLGADTDDNASEYLDDLASGAAGPSAASGGPSSGSGPAGTGAPGSACACDSDCAPLEGFAGVCVYGVCMTKASAACSSAGSTAECPSGSSCYGLQGEDGYLCWPDCSANACAGSCDADGACAPSDKTSCSYSCGSYCSCKDGDCAAGSTCMGGKCVTDTDVGDGPGPGPGPTCDNLPARDCAGDAATCGELVVFDPRTTAHYDDYPLNGETANNQYRSYLRRDLRMLLDYATAKVHCKSQGWPGNGGALGFGDMSESNGDVPGTSIGEPGHPKGTHTNGFDIDLGYYQVNTADNKLRPICENKDYHCTKAPHLLDTWRHALFLGTLFESKRVRVIGVDGQAGTMLVAALSELCKTGWVDPFACDHVKLAYETTDMGYGWYYFHHHHTHVSLCPGNTPCNNLTSSGAMEPLGPGMSFLPVKPNTHFFHFPTP